jgi:tetratricopeptide (TPR) repeat protein
MAKTTSILLAILTMVGICFSQSMTQDSLEIMLERAKDHYYGGEYESAIKQLQSALLYLKQLKQTDQVEAYKYLAFSYVAFGDHDKAKVQFRKALILDPQLELDPATVSPKIIKVFEEAKAEMAVAPVIEPKGPIAEVTTDEISWFDAAIRSCCVGGWGQMYRGEHSKGKKMMIAWGVTMGTTLVSWIMTTNKRDKYDELYWNQPSSAFDAAYSKYKRWYNVAIASTLVFAGVHAYNLFDVIFHKPPTGTSMIEPSRTFVCEASRDQVKFGYTVKF